VAISQTAGCFEDLDGWASQPSPSIRSLPRLPSKCHAQK
jgi:hypothetical protein